MAGVKGYGVKGNGVSGGGLKARQTWWDNNAAKSGGYMPNGNGINNQMYHRPGSQNPSKGGKGNA